MATRSSISIKTAKGGKTIYCHWDGYPSHNGRILLESFNTEDRVLELIKLGNLSILGHKIGGEVKFDGFDSSTDQCLAYGRDRGETEQEASDFDKKPTDLQEYNYLFKEGKWYVSKSGKRYVLLTEEMCKE
jgi:hypothetical protein